MKKIFTLILFAGLLLNKNAKASIHFNNLIFSLCSQTTYGTINATVCSPQTYFFNNKTIHQSGVYNDTLINYLGCDSILTLHLTVATKKTKFLQMSICNGNSITIGNKLCDKSGTFRDTINTYLGCDSIIILDLLVFDNSSFAFSDTICSNQIYIYHNNHLTQSGTYIDTLYNAVFCDSIVTLHLFVKPSSSKSFNQIICSNQSYFFNQHFLKHTGIYLDTLINYYGCDSLVTLHLTVLNTSQSSYIHSICSNQTYLFNQHLLNSSGTYYDTLQNYLGCDSVITLHLNVLHTSQSIHHQSICSNQSFYFNQHLINTSGTYYDTLVNYLGCDSILILNLSVLSTSQKTIHQTICNNHSYLFGTLHLTTAGTYYDTLQNHIGCDSFITLYLSVLPISSSTILQTLCSGQSYFFHHQNIKVGGTFKDTLVNYVGCDSVITLYLSVLPTTSSSYSQTLCYGNSILFNHHLFNQTGSYYDTLTNYVGCDSVVALQLTILPYNHTFVQASFCQGEHYNYHGKLISINGIYDDTLIAANGCDSVNTLLLSMKTVDTTVIQKTNSLVATATNSFFQWINCTTYQNVAGANDSIFYPQQVGNYAVVVQSKSNLCTDTSKCFSFQNVGIENNESYTNGGLSVYPNPTKNQLTITSNQFEINKIEIQNVLAQSINCELVAILQGVKINTSILVNGIYFLKVIDTKGTQHIVKFIKE